MCVAQTTPQLCGRKREGGDEMKTGMRKCDQKKEWQFIVKFSFVLFFYDDKSDYHYGNQAGLR